MPFIIFRYIIREVAYPTLLTLVAMTFVMFMNVKVPGYRDEHLIVMLIRMLFRPDIPKGDLITSFLFMLPSTLIFTAPLALLIGIIIGIGRMTIDLEVRAMQTSGINLIVAFLPVMFIGAALSATIGLLSYAPQPMMTKWAMQHVGKLLVSEFSSLEPGRIYDEVFGDDSGINLHFDARTEDDKYMTGVTVMLDRGAFESEEEMKKRDTRRNFLLLALQRQFNRGDITADQLALEEESIKVDEAENPIMIFARRASFSADPENGMVHLILEDGSIHLHDAARDQSSASTSTRGSEGTAAAGEGSAQGREYCVVQFGKLSKAEPILRMDAVGPRRVQTVPQLKLQMQDENLKLRNRRGAHAIILERYSLALQSLVFAFIGLPLAIWIRPTGKSVGVLLAFGLILVYYWLMGTGGPMVESGHPLGGWVIFSPNIVFGAAGAFLWWRALRK